MKKQSLLLFVLFFAAHFFAFAYDPAFDQGCDVEMTLNGQYYISFDGERMTEDSNLEDALWTYRKFVANDKCRSKNHEPKPICKVHEKKNGLWVALKSDAYESEKISQPSRERWLVSRIRDQFIEAGLCTSTASFCDIDVYNGRYYVTRDGEKISDGFWNATDAILKRNNFINNGRCSVTWGSELDVCSIINDDYRYYLTKGGKVFSGFYNDLDTALSDRRFLINHYVCRHTYSPKPCSIESYRGYFYIEHKEQFLSGYYRSYRDARYDLNALDYERVCSMSGGGGGGWSPPAGHPGYDPGWQPGPSHPGPKYPGHTPPKNPGHTPPDPGNGYEPPSRSDPYDPPGNTAPGNGNGNPPPRNNDPYEPGHGGGNTAPGNGGYKPPSNDPYDPGSGNRGGNGNTAPGNGGGSHSGGGSTAPGNGSAPPRSGG